MKEIINRTQILKLLCGISLILGIAIFPVVNEVKAAERGKCLEYKQTRRGKRCAVYERKESPKEKAAKSLQKKRKTRAEIRRENQDKARQRKALADQNKSGCCSGGVCKVSETEFSCNLMENTPIEQGPLNKDLFELFSGVKIVANSTDKNTTVPRGTNEFCESCFSKVYHVQPEFSEVSFEKARESVVEKVKLEKMKQEFRRLAGVHFKLKSYYEHNKEVIERQMKISSATHFIREAAGISTSVMDEAIRNRDLCLPLTTTSYEVGGWANLDFLDYDSDEYVESTEESTCDKNSKRILPAVAKDLGIELDIDLSEKSISDHDVGQQLNDALESFVDKKVAFVVAGQTPKNIYESKVMIGEFYKSLPANLSENYDELKEICGKDDEYEKKSLILPIIFKGNLGKDKTIAEKLTRSMNLLETISMMDPGVNPFLASTKPLCDYIKENTAADISGDEISKNIRLVGLNKEEKEKRIYKQFQDMRDLTCGSFVENITNILCTENDRANDYNLNIIEADDLPDNEKLALASLQCSQTKNSAEGEDIDIYALIDNSFADAVFKAIEGSGDNKKHLISRATEEPSRGGLSKNIVQENTPSGGTNSSGSSGDGDVSPSGGDVSRNFIQNGEDIIARDKNKEDKGRMTVNVDQDPAEAKTSFGDAAEANKLATIEDTVEEENTFNTNMQNILNDSISNTSSQNLNSIGSEKTVAEMIEEDISQTEKMQVLNEDEAIAEQYVEVKEKLKDQLVPGEDPNAALQNAILGEEDIEKSDLVCESEDKEKCEGQNAELLAEIKKLKEQVNASAKVSRAEELDSASEKRIKALEEELAKFKQIASAKIDTTTPSTNLKSIGGNGNTISAGATIIGGQDGKSLFKALRKPAGSEAVSTQAFKGDKIITNVVKNNPEQFISQKDFDLSLNGNSLVLTIDSEKISKAPVDLDSIILDSSGQVQKIAIAGGKPISITTLSTSSRSAVEKFIASNKGSLAEQTKQVESEINSLKKVQLQAKAESVRYNQLLCSMNPGGSSCTQ